MKTSITILLRTLSPLHITAPEDCRVTTDGQRVYGQRGFPCSLTQKLTIPLRPEDAKDEKSAQTVPLIPANTIRGRLRRMSAQAILAQIEANGETLSLPAWQGLQSGAIYGHPDSSRPSVDQMRADYESVYLGTWGGSSRLVPSVVSVGAALPVIDATLDAGLVPGASLNDAVGGRLTQTFFFRRVDDTIVVADPRRGGQIHKFDESYTDWVKLFGPQAKEALGETDGAVDDAPEEKPSKVQGVMSFSAREVVSPNVTFMSEIQCGGEPHHLGMVVEALRRWAEDPYIGGCRRLGMGRLELQIQIGGAPVFVTSGNRVMVDEEHEVAAAHAEAIQKIEQIAAGDVEAMFKPEEKSAKALLKKLKGDEADAFERLYAS
jgi:CRISPR type IV-associated protein Csf2